MHIQIVTNRLALAWIRVYLTNEDEDPLMTSEAFGSLKEAEEVAEQMKRGIRNVERIFEGPEVFNSVRWIHSDDVYFEDAKSFARAVEAFHGIPPASDKGEA